MKKFFTKKRYWILILIVTGLCALWFFASDNNAIPDGVETGTVERGEVIEVVSETGFVQATKAVDMAFERGGRVIEILVEEGSEVQAGDILVRLDSSSVSADLASAYARLEAEQVRLQELLTGADSNSLAVTQSSVISAETAVENAKRNLDEVITQQNQLVANAEKTLRTSGLQAYLVSGERENSDDSYAAPTVSGTYTSDIEGVYRLELYSSGAASGASYRVSGIESGTESVSTVNPTPVGNLGLYVQFPDNFAPRTEWEIPIPNTRSGSYLTNLNAYNSAVEGRDLAIANAENAVKAAESALNQGQTQLVQASGSARDERVAAQRALVRQMHASVQSVQVQYDNMILVAPFDGVITNLYTEVGQIVSATAPAVSLISKGQYELTVSVSEVDIAEISIGDEASVQFDAYDDDYFTAHVVRISPNAILTDGVRVFEITLVFDQVNEKIRDGLSADIDITTARREDVIAIPTRSIYQDADGKFVRIITPEETVAKVRVETGLRGSDGKSEVVSGLTGGETIVTFASEDDLAQLEN